MKQITLEATVRPVGLKEVCTGRLLFVWGLFGVGMVALWSLAGPSAGAHAIVWAIGIVAGLALVSKIWEV